MLLEKWNSSCRKLVHDKISHFHTLKYCQQPKNKTKISISWTYFIKQVPHVHGVFFCMTVKWRRWASEPTIWGSADTPMGPIALSILPWTKKHNYKTYQPLDQVRVFSQWLKIKDTDWMAHKSRNRHGKVVPGCPIARRQCSHSNIGYLQRRPHALTLELGGPTGQDNGPTAVGSRWWTRGGWIVLF